MRGALSAGLRQTESSMRWSKFGRGLRCQNPGRHVFSEPLLPILPPTGMHSLHCPALDSTKNESEFEIGNFVVSVFVGFGSGLAMRKLVDRAKPK